jgi:hypothetical protein
MSYEAAAKAEHVEKVESEEERAGKERVRDKVARLLREIRGGAVFGGARKALWEEVEALVGRLKGEETVGEMEAERKKEEERAAKKGGV